MKTDAELMEAADEIECISREDEPGVRRAKILSALLWVRDDGAATSCKWCEHVKNGHRNYCPTHGDVQAGSRLKARRLTEREAEIAEDELRKMESDPSVDKHALRLYMQSAMPCGHAVGNLLTCPTPPYGCVICGQMDERGHFQAPQENQCRTVHASDCTGGCEEHDSSVSLMLDELGVPKVGNDEARLVAYAEEVGRCQQFSDDAIERLRRIARDLADCHYPATAVDIVVGHVGVALQCLMMAQNRSQDDEMIRRPVVDSDVFDRAHGLKQHSGEAANNIKQTSDELTDSPLALTDEELDRIYKTITATGIRGGATVTRWSGGPHLFAVVAPATRGSNERVIAHVGKSLDADVIMHAFNNLAFLIESLRSERQAVNKLLSQRGGPNTQASNPRGLEAGAGLSAKESD